MKLRGWASASGASAFLPACLVALLFMSQPEPGNGQEVRGQVGVVVPTEDRMGGGPYLGAALTLPTRRPWLALRLSGGVGFTEHLTSVVPAGELTESSILGKRAESQNAYDVNLSLVVRRPAGPFQPFLTAGVGYYRLAPGTDDEPLLHGAGFNGGVGTTFQLGAVDLGLELGLRVFGGYLGGTSGERSFAPLTLSVGW